MSQYGKDYQSLVKQLKELRKRIAKREQADQQRLNTSNPNRVSAVQRDIQKAQARQQRAQDNFSATQTGIKRRRYPTAQETRDAADSRSGVSSSSSSSSSNKPKKTKYPTAAETRAAAAARRAAASSSSSSSGSSSSSSSGRRTSGQYAVNAPDYSSSAAKADNKSKEAKGLRADFSDVGGRLGAALGAAQDAILAERKIKRGLNYGSEDTNDYSLSSKPDYSGKAAKADPKKKAKTKPSDYKVKSTDYSSRAAQTSRESARQRAANIIDAASFSLKNPKDYSSKAAKAKRKKKES